MTTVHLFLCHFCCLPTTLLRRVSVASTTVLCSMEQICAAMRESGILLQETIGDLVNEIVGKEETIRRWVKNKIDFLNIGQAKLEH